MAVIDFNVDPYYDDFEGTTGAKSKNFHRVLFRPAFPVQARELTQLQSILQKQVERHGRHIFKEGFNAIPVTLHMICNMTLLKFNQHSMHKT